MNPTRQSGAERKPVARIRRPRPGFDRAAGPVRSQLEQLLRNRAVRCVYQPVIDLYDNSVLGYEALARGPVGSALERPDDLFAAARREGLLAELDRACHAVAVTGALQAGLTAPLTLFINTEPAVASTALFDEPTPDRLRIVIELTERALTADPPQLLSLVARIRARGWGIALDDVGAEPNSLALLPLLRPDVIKLDLRLVQQQPSANIAAIVSAVNAEAERSGTLVLAEGIETEEHLRVALALGATLGQGWLFGRPGPLPDVLPVSQVPAIPISTASVAAPASSPFALGASRVRPRATDKRLLIEISKHLERHALRSGDAAVVLATFQSAEFFTADTRRRYAELARGAAFVGALGAGMPDQPLPGIRGGRLGPDDVLCAEWDIAVVGPHYAATLLAYDLGGDEPDPQRRFEFVLSHDRDLAVEVAVALMARISPVTEV